MNDLEIFYYINGMAGQNTTLDYFFIFLTQLGLYLMLLVILSTRNKKLITKSIAALALVFAVDFIINLIWYRPRPFVGNEVNLLVNQGATASFPSRHAMMAFSMAASFYLWNKRYSIIMFVLAAFIALSRVWVGVHYLSDITAGAILGVVVALIIEYVFEKYKIIKLVEKKLKIPTKRKQKPYK